MSYEEVIFWAVGALTVAAAAGVVFSRNVVHAALFLMLALFATAGVFVLLAAEFLAIVQVLVYGGAVTILIMFAMMLTRVRDLPTATNGPQQPFALLVAGAFAGTSIGAIAGTNWPGETDRINVISFNDISTALFTTWAIPFEVASLLLMVALIGAVVLARGEEGE